MADLTQSMISIWLLFLLADVVCDLGWKKDVARFLESFSGLITLAIGFIVLWIWMQ
ncbi:MAG: hypothetical protein WC677_07600 [Clostridia bacterium]|jgi:hypothetical protein